MGGSVGMGYNRVEIGKFEGDLCKLLLGAVVYHVQKQRNDIKHGNNLKAEDQILKNIDWGGKKLSNRCGEVLKIRIKQGDML